jgi:hypothetical protein
MIASTTTTTNYHGGIHWPDIHFFDSLPVSDDDGDVCGPAAKKAKVPGGGHGAVRRHVSSIFSAFELFCLLSCHVLILMPLLIRSKIEWQRAGLVRRRSRKRLNCSRI